MVQQADFVTAALQDCDPVLPGRLILGTPMIHEPTITVSSKAQHHSQKSFMVAIRPLCCNIIWL